LTGSSTAVAQWSGSSVAAMGFIPPVMLVLLHVLVERVVLPCVWRGSPLRMPRRKLPLSAVTKRLILVTCVFLRENWCWTILSICHRKTSPKWMCSVRRATTRIIPRALRFSLSRERDQQRWTRLRPLPGSHTEYPSSKHPTDGTKMMSLILICCQSPH
jgi:hypothetical protein